VDDEETDRCARLFATFGQARGVRLGLGGACAQDDTTPRQRLTLFISVRTVEDHATAFLPTALVVLVEQSTRCVSVCVCMSVQ